jgi:fused signal recognition particle receptor
VLAGLLKDMLSKAGSAAPLADGRAVVLLLGVNGVGKTTTAAKLCARFADRAPVLAAADTFRAGAIEQLKIHGERLGARVVAHKSAGDPAAVVYDALAAAAASGSRLVIADTAGRMHTKKSLIEELKKIDRVVQNADNDSGKAQYLKYLVLDATTGRNAVAQAEVFNEAVHLDGVILSKCDSTAKGGIVFSLAQQFALPVAFVCFGEGYDAIAEFDADAFIDKFLG